MRATWIGIPDSGLAGLKFLDGGTQGSSRFQIDVLQINSYRFRLAPWTFSRLGFNLATLPGKPGDHQEVLYEIRQEDPRFNTHHVTYDGIRAIESGTENYCESSI